MFYDRDNNVIDFGSHGIKAPTGLELSSTSGLIISGTTVDGISFTGTSTGDFIDFSGVTYVPTGSNGPSLLRCGTYASPLTHAVEAQSGLMRWYMETSANGTSYDRGLFVCLKTTGTKSVFPIAALAEVKEQTGAGPLSCMAGQFVSHLNSATAIMPASGATNGLFAIWAKITANDGATLNAATHAAAIWVDNQLYGANAATCDEEYGIWMTTGGSRPKAVFGFETTSSGYDNFLDFNSTYSTSIAPCNGGAVSTNTGASAGSLKMLINGTSYLIPFFTA